MKLKAFIATILNLLIVVGTTVGQCPMCKMSAESSDVSGGMNLGVLYLLAIPIIFIVALIVIYKRYKEDFQ